jgi:hypothetical protein
MTVACCYASGHIGFFPEVPIGLEALPICEGPDAAVKKFISGVARHSRDGSDLFVPGVPENRGEWGDQDLALNALFAFLKWIGKNPPKGIYVFGGKGKRSRAARRAA